MVEKPSNRTSSNPEEDPNSELNVLRREVRQLQAAVRDAALQVAASQEEVASLRSALALADTEVEESLARETVLKAQVDSQKLKRQNVESTLAAAEALVLALKDIAIETIDNQKGEDQQVDDDIDVEVGVNDTGATKQLPVVAGGGGIHMDVMDVGSSRADANRFLIRQNQRQKDLNSGAQLDQLLSKIDDSSKDGDNQPQINQQQTLQNNNSQLLSNAASNLLGTDEDFNTTAEPFDNTRVRSTATGVQTDLKFSSSSSPITNSNTYDEDDDDEVDNDEDEDEDDNDEDEDDDAKDDDETEEEEYGEEQDEGNIDASVDENINPSTKSVSPSARAPKTVPAIFSDIDGAHAIASSTSNDTKPSTVTVIDTKSSKAEAENNSASDNIEGDQTIESPSEGGKQAEFPPSKTTTTTSTITQTPRPPPRIAPESLQQRHSTPHASNRNEFNSSSMKVKSVTPSWSMLTSGGIARRHSVSVPISRQNQIPKLTTTTTTTNTTTTTAAASQEQNQQSQISSSPSSSSSSLGGLLRNAFGVVDKNNNSSGSASKTSLALPSRITKTIADAHSGDILCISSSYDGRFLASGGDDRCIRIYDSNGVPCGRITDNSKSVTAITFPRQVATNSDTLVIFGGGSDGVIRSFSKRLVNSNNMSSNNSNSAASSVSSRRVTRQKWISGNVFPVHTQGIKKLQILDNYSNDGSGNHDNLVVSCSTDRWIKISDVERLKRPFAFITPSAVLDFDILYSSSMSNQSMVISGHKDGGIRLWSTRERSNNSPAISGMKTHSKAVTCVRALDGNGYEVVSIGRDNWVRVCDTRVGIKCIREMECNTICDWHKLQVMNFGGSSTSGGGGRFVASGDGYSRRLKIWNVDNGKLIKQLNDTSSTDTDVLGLVSRNLRDAGAIVAPYWNDSSGIFVCAHRTRQLSIWDF